MSISPEALIAPSEPALSESKIRPETQPLCFTQPLLRMMEGQILTIQLMSEATGVVKELYQFNSLKYSRNQKDRDLYFGTPNTSGNKQIIMANGFIPYNIATEHPFTAPLVEFWQNILPPLKSNTILEPKRQWYERHGHKAKFAFDRPNHIWFQNFKDTYNAAIDAIADSEVDGRDVWIDGLSAGGMLGEMVLKKLAKKGYAVNLITNGSPEVNEENLKLFDESVMHPGIMGSVHQGAILSRKMDVDYERMQDEIKEAVNSDFHPDSQVVRFYSDADQICPPPQDPTALEVGEVHTAIPYRKKVLIAEEVLLAGGF